MLTITIVVDKSKNIFDLTTKVKEPKPSELLSTLGMLRKTEDRLLKMINSGEK